ncbi:heterokaryon incompatibility protein het-E-1 [Fusarium subglutinans]|uniref:Heterokaryon incompatibility protein het-E-1 n=1 Tax=Gibberella subglutinans TaxID=42677 RepID=A0A8H5Q5I9_GIBSU|nr:heterokaryon incompatibility protein het-E-1 [Fusarium subglutinans]KAF5609536.1 heterokaryon incompatibility protein het-E-1 [Fusarium subglutinans]
MYLINVSTLKLEEFYSSVPEYAILSHTWGQASEEVLFQEMLTNSSDVKLKKGYKKIELCAKQAQKDGLDYCWVDTCCIDKSRSAELSEAINSMFSWYRNSAVCYLYLEDVIHKEHPGRIDESLGEARWFTRGWTLQELLAPRARQFFDANWTMIGEISKNRYREHLVNGFFRMDTTADEEGDPQELEGMSLASQVAQITGIPRKVLYIGDLGSFSAATRMSWAARRRTTRIEDQAYCLLGIFDVHMPLLYGEGNHAFIRLQEEIVKKEPDHTLFAWRSEPTSPAPTFSGLLAPSPGNFYSDHCRGILPKQVDLPYEMTNKGLHLQVRLVEHNPGSDEFYAILSITHQSDTKKDIWYGIKLGRLDSCGQYARINTGEQLVREVETTRTLSIKPTHIYIQHFIRHNSPLYGRNKPSTVVLGCAMESMSLTILEASGSKSWDSESFTFLPSKDDLFYARLAFHCRPNLKGSSPLNIGWIVRKDDVEGIKSHLAILKEKNDLYRPNTLWENGIRSGIVKIYPQSTYHIRDGEMVAMIALHDQIILKN